MFWFSHLKIIALWLHKTQPMFSNGYSHFVLKQDYFDHESVLHGINHTYRVMFHVLNIGQKAGMHHEIKIAFCAAFIHDMARLHDGYCTEHGPKAAKLKFPHFKNNFIKLGFKDDDLRAIKLAVSNHSMRHEIFTGHKYYKTVALLKDADALDRIRIGENNLKIQYLRIPESLHLVDFARQLYFRTTDLPIQSFEEILEIAKTIPGQ